MITDDKRIRIIAGHYGSGKTTFALNYILKLSQYKKKIIAADLDIVNPYFRIREQKEIFDKHSVVLLGSMIMESGGDLPALSKDVLRVFYDKEYDSVVDLGGDDVGARSMSLFREHTQNDETDLFIVVNAMREATNTAEKIIEYTESIERTLGKKADAFVANTHLMEYTDESVIREGLTLAEEAAKIKNIDVRYVCVEKKFKNVLNNIDNLFVFEYSVRPDYLINYG